LARVSYGRRITDLASLDPDALAYVFRGETLSRGELESRTNRLARAYAERGVKQGDLVTLAAPNSLDLVGACKTYNV